MSLSAMVAWLGGLCLVVTAMGVGVVLCILAAMDSYNPVAMRYLAFASGAFGATTLFMPFFFIGLHRFKSPIDVPSVIGFISTATFVACVTCAVAASQVADGGASYGLLWFGTLVPGVVATLGSLALLLPVLFKPEWSGVPLLGIP